LYTKTQLSDTAIKAAATNLPLGHLLIKSLRESATLIVTDDDVTKLKRLPTTLWSVFKDDLVHKRIKYRLIPDEQWQDWNEVAVEVLLEEPPQQTSTGPARSDIVNYSETAPVRLRSNVRSGVEALTNREQFWTECLLPVIETTLPQHRHIHLVDQYAFHDARKAVLTRRGNLREGHLLDSGLLWLLSKLNFVSRGLPRKVDVSITACETDQLNTDQIKEFLDIIANKLDTRALSIAVHIVAAREILRRPAGFIARQLFINDNAHFMLSHGMRDFSLPRDESALTGAFFASCNTTVQQAIQDLSNLNQTTLKIQYDLPTAAK